jgi:hypothetical protein
MSIASSSASSVSVNHHGSQIDLETALDETIRDLQRHLNLIQCHLRTLAADSERDNDFQQMIGVADELENEIDDITWLFVDLRGYCYDIVGLPSGDEKTWLKSHKAIRKAYFQKKTLEKKAQIKKEKQDAKGNSMDEE